MEFFKMCFTSFAMVSFLRLIASCSENKDDSDTSDNGGGTGGDPEPDCLNAGTNVSISDNHGHQLTVSKSAVAAGVEETYNITGIAGHSHTVTITSAHFASLAANQQVSIMSTGGAHTHSVTVTCKLA